MDSRYLDTILNSFYKNGYEEDERLTSDKMHYVEFITTTNYIDKYLKPGDRILEIGAGAGAYSLHYAKKGFQVDALELVQANVDVMKIKLLKKLENKDYTFEYLNKLGIKAIRGPRKIAKEVSEKIK